MFYNLIFNNHKIFWYLWHFRLAPNYWEQSSQTFLGLFSLFFFSGDCPEASRKRLLDRTLVTPYVVVFVHPWRLSPCTSRTITFVLWGKRNMKGNEGKKIKKEVDADVGEIPFGESLKRYASHKWTSQLTLGVFLYCGIYLKGPFFLLFWLKLLSSLNRMRAECKEHSKTLCWKIVWN